MIEEEVLTSWLLEKGYPAFRAEQIFSWIYQKGVKDWYSMTNLSQSLREELAQQFALFSLKEVRRLISQDDETEKFLWELGDGNLVESVLIHAPERKTVCISSQVGCGARCAFCASGRQGLMRNLSAHEIVEQVLHIDTELKKKGERVTHIVFMGMGEPLDNYEEVTRAIRFFTDPKRFHFSPRRITVSTVGVIPAILRLAAEDLKVNLVLSLHAPNQHLRKKLIPYARKYELSEILAAMRYYSQKTGRDTTYEYTLIEGINDGENTARELADLLKKEQCTVNLIPYNPIAGLKLKRPQKEVIEAFKNILMEAHIPTTQRYTKGKDIAAACGQLALAKKEELLSIHKQLEKSGI